MSQWRISGQRGDIIICSRSLCCHCGWNDYWLSSQRRCISPPPPACLSTYGTYMYDTGFEKKREKKMRPVSIFSATLCGVLWLSVGAIVRAAPQADGVATTPSITTPAIPMPTDYSLECLAVYLPAEVCQNSCRAIGVVRAATEGSCVKIDIPAGLVTDVSTKSTAIRTVTDNIARTTATITLVNGMPLYETTGVENYGTPVTRTFTFTRGVSESAVTNPTATGTAPGSEVSNSADRPAATAGSDGSSATTTAVPARSSGGGGKSTNTGAIAGGVVGGILGLLLIVAAILFIRRRKRKSAPRDAFSSLEKNRGESSPQSTTMPQIPITSYDPPQPMEMQEPHPESQRSLMGSYPPPTGMTPTKQQVEVDEDGVSLRSPTPPLGEEDVERGRDYVPRLPIYHRGSDETPRGPAL
ncbi:hypothetical protein DFP73DRAFT_34220 [Morchella snyderi]|nr:hypothetical protein DFP73DRAFT_34220 [Morchella snyderi]